MMAIHTNAAVSMLSLAFSLAVWTVRVCCPGGEGSLNEMSCPFGSLWKHVQGKTDVVTTEGGAGHDHSHRFANLLGVRLKVRNAWPGSQTRNGIRKPSQKELGNPKVRTPSPGFVRGRRRPGAALARSCQRRRRPGAALARSCQRRRRLGAALAA